MLFFFFFSATLTRAKCKDIHDAELQGVTLQARWLYACGILYYEFYIIPRWWKIFICVSCFVIFFSQWWMFRMKWVFEIISTSVFKKKKFNFNVWSYFNPLLSYHSKSKTFITTFCNFPNLHHTCIQALPATFHSTFARVRINIRWRVENSRGKVSLRPAVVTREKLYKHSNSRIYIHRNFFLAEREILYTCECTRVYV